MHGMDKRKQMDIEMKIWDRYQVRDTVAMNVIMQERELLKQILLLRLDLLCIQERELLYHLETSEFTYEKESIDRFRNTLEGYQNFKKREIIDQLNALDD